MSFQRLSVEERARRLQAYLEQISPDQQLESAREQLESATGVDGAGENLEVMEADNQDEREGLETLDIMIRGGDMTEVSPGSLDSLEAIIHKRERPAVNIINDTFNPPAAPWHEFGIGETKKRLENVIPSVGRIEVPNDLRGRLYGGTGFVVGENLLMTNRHVAKIFAQGLGKQNLRFDPGQVAAVDFKREIPQAGAPDPVLLDVTEILMIHPYWDMALLQVVGLPEKHAMLRLSVRAPEDLVGHNVAVIGYPAQDGRSNLEVQNRIFGGVFEVKRLLPGKLNGRGKIESYGNVVSALKHDSSTLGGNSGSAVIDVETGEVVALHFAGEYLKANYAVPMSDLAQDSEVVDAGVNFIGRVDPRSNFYGPIWAGTHSGEFIDPDPGPSRQSPPPPVQAITPSKPTIQINEPSAVTWTIPVNVSVSIGTPTLMAGSEPILAQKRQAPAEGLFSRQPSTSASDFITQFSLPSLSAPSFDWKTALSMALASQLSYEKVNDVRNTALNTWGLETCEFIEADDTQCFVASSQDVVLVAFRGTASVGDWLTDLNVLSTSRSYGHVHRGFHTAFQVVDSQLRSILSRRSHHSLLLTGHSLGGALATIAAAEWQGQIPISWIYTYGQPAVGKGNFPSFIRQHYAGKFFRFVNDDDIVPLVPPTYRHIGRLFHFDAAGNVESGTESSMGGADDTPMMTEDEFDRLRAQLLEQRARRRTAGAESLEIPGEEGLLPSIGDHRLVRYIAKIADKVDA